MPYYVTCPNCGCNLDPGEACDCGDLATLDMYPAGHELSGLVPETAHSDVLIHSY